MNKNGRNFKFSGGNFINIRDNQSKIGGKLKVRGKYVWSKSEYATFTSGKPIFKNRFNMLILIKLRKSRIGHSR